MTNEIILTENVNEMIPFTFKDKNGKYLETQQQYFYDLHFKSLPIVSYDQESPMYFMQFHSNN